MLSRRAVQAVKRAAKWTSVAVGIIGDGCHQRNCPQVLTYHRVSDLCGQELAVTKANFRWQMDWLAKHAKVISLEEALNPQTGGCQGCPTVVLTFDDGYRDIIDNALPILRDHGFPAVVYVVPGAIEGKTGYWWDSSSVEDFLSWDQLESMVESANISVGSHSMYHHDLDALCLEEVEDDLRQSRDSIVLRFGSPRVHFSYPRGRLNRSIVTVAARYYASAAAMSNGVPLVHPSALTRWRFRRIPVQRSDGKRLFVERVRGRLWLEESARDAISRYFSKPRRNE